MIKEHVQAFKRLMFITDLCLVAISFFIGHIIMDKSAELSDVSFYFEPLAILLVVVGASLSYFEMYTSFRVKNLFEILILILKVVLTSFIIFSGLIYIFKITTMNRALTVMIFVIIAALLAVEKFSIILFFRYLRRKGYNYRLILVVGTGKRAQRFIELVHEHAEWGLRVMGIVDEDRSKIGEVINGHKVIGGFDDIESIIHNQVVDEAVFVIPRSWLLKIEPLLFLFEIQGIKTSVAVDLFELKIAKAKQEHFHEIPLLTFQIPPDQIWQLMIKRIFDVVSSGLALLFLMPLFIVVALIIKVTDRGAVLFKQKRCTLSGRKFILYKFRTMVEDAEEKLAELKMQNELNGPAFKMENDPRIIKVGKFLRKFSLDELPQLWNVFIGDMSMVGPRPAIPIEIEKYDNWQRRRLSMRAGITCIWQVEGRNKIVDFNEWMEMDLKYIDNWSLLLDFKILLKTIPIVIFGIGAK